MSFFINLIYINIKTETQDLINDDWQFYELQMDTDFF